MTLSDLFYDVSNNTSYIAAAKACEKENKELTKKSKNYDFTNFECYDLQGKNHYTSLLNKKWA